MVRIYLSDGEKVEIRNKPASQIVNALNRTANANLALVEVTTGVWINPGQVTSVVQVGEE